MGVAPKLPHYTTQRRVGASSWPGYVFWYPLVLLIWVVFVWVFVYLHRADFPKHDKADLHGDMFVGSSAEDVFLLQATERP
mmetsp:Transcript_30529/g.66652  ORF Transcript_30529/g.66652 Transcript_30529/m.66652 type:complete len:81 (-) Transcript_30529:346-588(-)